MQKKDGKWKKSVCRKGTRSVGWLRRVREGGKQGRGGACARGRASYSDQGIFKKSADAPVWLV